MREREGLLGSSAASTGCGVVRRSASAGGCCGATASAGAGSNPETLVLDGAASARFAGFFDSLGVAAATAATAGVGERRPRTMRTRPTTSKTMPRPISGMRTESRGPTASARTASMSFTTAATAIGLPPLFSIGA